MAYTLVYVIFFCNFAAQNWRVYHIRLMNAKSDIVLTKQRNSNLEIFRILLMLSIVAHHYVVNSGLLDIIAEPPYTWKHYFMYIFGMWGKIGINCFVLITGYYMCRSDITIRKFLKLLFEILFYNAVIYIAFSIGGYESFSLGGFCSAINPIKSISRDFVSCFLIYYLFIPFLNILVDNLTQKQHGYLVFLCVSFFVIMDHFPGIEYRFNYVGWFCILHIIASYLRFYLLKPPLLKREVACIITGAGIAVVSVVGQCMLIEQGWHVGWQYKWVADCNAFVGLLSSVMMFIGFKNLQMKNYNWINTIASSTFAVLLIHANSDVMRKWLWQDVCHNVDWIYSHYMPLHAIGCVLAIFIACVLIDKVRMSLIEKPTFKIIDKYLLNYGIK